MQNPQEEISQVIEVLKEADGRMRRFFDADVQPQERVYVFLDIWYMGLLAVALQTFTDSRTIATALAQKGVALDSSRMVTMTQPKPSVDGSRAGYLAALNICTAVIDDLQYLLSLIALAFENREYPIPAKLLVLNAKKSVSNLMFELMQHYTKQAMSTMGEFENPAQSNSLQEQVAISSPLISLGDPNSFISSPLIEAAKKFELTDAQRRFASSLVLSGQVDAKFEEALKVMCVHYGISVDEALRKLKDLQTHRRSGD